MRKGKPVKISVTTGDGFRFDVPMQFLKIQPNKGRGRLDRVRVPFSHSPADTDRSA